MVRILKHSMIITLALLICTFCVGCIGLSKNSHDTDNTEADTTKPVISITNPEKSKIGRITVVDQFDETVFSYYGNIEIRNDGRNGKDIDVYVRMTEGKDN